MTVEIDVPNADNHLLPGMTVEVKMPLQETSPDSLIVPAASLVLQGRPVGQGVTRLVYIVRDGKAYSKEVTVRFQDGENAEIVKDIEASELIITNPENIKVGMPVKIEKAP
jgi:multidrug efflux pump subunit AcrA (membrane-fusion protein)